MAGLDPSDPRFEKAVRYGLSLFRRTRIQSADLEDIAQQIRLDLWLQGGVNPYRIARLRAIDWWRHYWGRKRGDVGYAQREISMPDVDRAPELDRGIDLPLQVLAPRESWILARHYGAGESMREIGRALGITGERVGQILKGAREQLLRARDES